MRALGTFCCSLVFCVAILLLERGLSVLDFALQSCGGTRRETARRLFVFQGFGGSGRPDWMSAVLLVLFWGWPIAWLRRVRRVRLMGMGRGLSVSRLGAGLGVRFVVVCLLWPLESTNGNEGWSFSLQDCLVDGARSEARPQLDLA